MHKVAKFVFWSTLLLFGAVLIFASYVGVYLTYVAIPVIIVSGVIMKMTKPKFKKELRPLAKFLSEAKTFIVEEAVDAKEVFKNEAKDIETWRANREAERNALPNQRTDISNK